MRELMFWAKYSGSFSRTASPPWIRGYIAYIKVFPSITDEVMQAICHLYFWAQVSPTMYHPTNELHGKFMDPTHTRPSADARYFLVLHL